MIKRFSYLIVNIGIESDVIRYFHCMMIKLAIDDKIITVLSCYAPQVGLKNIIKDTSYDQMQNTVRKVGVDETLVICGDLNAHIIKLANGYEGVDGGYNYGLRNKVKIFSNLLLLIIFCWKLVFHQEKQPSDHLPVRWY